MPPLDWPKSCFGQHDALPYVAPIPWRTGTATLLNATTQTRSKHQVTTVQRTTSYTQTAARHQNCGQGSLDITPSQGIRGIAGLTQAQPHSTRHSAQPLLGLHTYVPPSYCHTLALAYTTLYRTRIRCVNTLRPLAQGTHRCTHTLEPSAEKDMTKKGRVNTST
jgi:hypothetical protein